MEEPFDSIVLIDKPTGISSFGVVNRVRWQLTEQLRLSHESRGFCTPVQHKEDASSGVSRTKMYSARATEQADAAMRGEPVERTGSARSSDWRCKCRVKVGHTGTLDPFATGLIILVIGKECKNASKYSKLDKVYEATITLGQTSSTGDPEGEITSFAGPGPAKVPKQGEIEEILGRFVGEIEQTPPVFSAIKINGQRAYKLARKGEAVEIPKRTVTIYSLELLDYKYPKVKIRTHVSSGTYIRSLASDIGLALNTGAYVTELRRTKVGKYLINEADSPFS